MRYTALAPLLLLAACGTGTPNSNEPAFTIQSEEVMIAPNQEITKCFYFRTTNTEPIAVNRWVSDMTPGSHHMIFFVGGPDHELGISEDDCGFNPANLLNQPTWVFASQTSHSEQPLPPDDGTGKPLAQVIQPNSLGAFQMHYLNQTDAPVAARVELEAYALPDSAEYTPTAPYITYNFDITVGPGAIGAKAEASCPAPAGKFWSMSTHAHKQSVKTEVQDGATMMFESADWEHPGAKLWDSDPFFTPESGKISWTCTYNNIGDNKDRTVVQGQSADRNEMCMAVGYYFPASSSQICPANFVNPGTGKFTDCLCFNL